MRARWQMVTVLLPCRRTKILAAALFAALTQAKVIGTWGKMGGDAETQLVDDVVGSC